MESLATLLYCCNGTFGGFEVTAEPFVCTIDFIKHLTFDAAAEKHIVNFLIVDGGKPTITHENGNFCVKKFVCNSGRLGVLVYSCLGSLVECTAVGRQRDVAVIKSGLTDFKAIAMCSVRYAEHINQLCFEV